MQCSQLLLVRHAESLANELTTESVAAGLGADVVRWRLDLLDCPITDIGRQQCLEAAVLFRDIKVDVVVVSPLYRTLQTCDLIFQGHPSNPTVLVSPLAYETMCCACDLSSLMTLPHPEFAQYDWSLVPQSDFWQFTIADNEITRESRPSQRNLVS
jgi:broad specificity phosphatase PhoE